MPVLNSHIELDIAVQKMDSFVYDNLKVEEKDWALNWAQDNYINRYYYPLANKYKQGFEDQQKITDQLKDLITTYETNLYKLPNKDWMRFALPVDYLFHDSTELEVYYDPCGKIDAFTFDGNEEVAHLPFNLTSLYNQYAVTDYTNFDIVDDSSNTSIFSTEFKNSLGNYSFPFDHDNLVLDAMNDINPGAIELHWENYKTVHNDNYFIYSDVGSIVYKITLDGNNFEKATQSNGRVKSETFSTYESDTVSGGQKEWHEARIVQSQDLRTSINHSFKKSRPKSPLCILNNQYFDIKLNGFVVMKAKMYYVRRPRRVSHQLGQDLELPPSTHNTIIQDAANYLLHLFQSKQYKTGVNEQKKTN